MANNQMLNQPSEQVNGLVHSFKHGLTIGQSYVELLSKLANTEDPDELLSAASDLVKFDLEDAFVKFPQHYKEADYYSLFMGRLMEMQGNEDFNLVEDQATHSFYATIASLGKNVRFHFTKDEAGNAAFTDIEDDESLFSINFTHKMLRFNNKSLINYMIVKGLKSYSDLDLRSAIKPLLAFASALEKKLSFEIDRGILDTNNDQHFDLAHPDLALTVIDRLFVKTAETDFMLFNLPKNNGAELRLDREIKLDISFDPDDYSRQWFFTVIDPENQVSLFDLLLHYQLIREWYLNNRDDLAVRSDLLMFADEPVEQSSVEPETKEKTDEEETEEVEETVIEGKEMGIEDNDD